MLIPKKCHTIEEMERFIRFFSRQAEDFFIVEGVPKLVVLKIPEEYAEEAQALLEEYEKLMGG